MTGMDDDMSRKYWERCYDLDIGWMEFFLGGKDDNGILLVVLLAHLVTFDGCGCRFGIYCATSTLKCYGLYTLGKRLNCIKADIDITIS